LSLRLKTGIWVDAFIRRCQVEGLFASVLTKGHADAGAVYVVINRLDGGHLILAPPPGPAYDEVGERRFELATSAPLDWPDAKAWLDRRRRSDSDLWVVEVEDRTNLAGLKIET
jgi:hypothetical protein